VPTSFSAVVYPNPLNPASRLLVAMPQAGGVAIEVFNASGQLLNTWSANLNAGTHHLPVQYLLKGKSISAGVYTLRIKAGTFTATRKVIIQAH
jgi:hypothetical protein